MKMWRNWDLYTLLVGNGLLGAVNKQQCILLMELIQPLKFILIKSSTQGKHGE